MGQDAQNISIKNINGEAPDEELLAIITAIKLYYHGGCEEKKITLKNNNSSAWNSKILGMNQYKK